MCCGWDPRKGRKLAEGTVVGLPALLGNILLQCLAPEGAQL